MELERYITIGIRNEMPVDIQIYLWGLQTTLIKDNEKVDYLQVYDLSRAEEGGECMQKISHKSEEPKFEKNYVVEVEKVMQARIFVISDRYTDKIVETMLLAEEY